MKNGRGSSKFSLRVIMVVSVGKVWRREREGVKVCILMGSPRKKGNTAALLSVFCEELKALGHDYELFWLYHMKIEGCRACRTCQKDWTMFGCPIRDDVEEIFTSVLTSDLLVFATPMHSWYCTPPMKALIDRLVYGMNKYYGEEKGPSLWAGKSVALLTTCGYPIEKGTDLWEAGMKRYCKHSKLQYQGMLAKRHMGYGIEFMDIEKERHVKTFVQQLMGRLQFGNRFASRKNC